MLSAKALSAPRFRFHRPFFNFPLPPEWIRLSQGMPAESTSVAGADPGTGITGDIGANTSGPGAVGSAWGDGADGCSVSAMVVNVDANCLNLAGSIVTVNCISSMGLPFVKLLDKD